jgi:hypothetical protein
MSDQKQRESAIRNELTRLAAEHGGELQPKAVVDAARSEDSPLHKSFDWDDSEAAEKWRLTQARNLIRAVVTYETVGNKTVETRVFVSLTPDRKENGDGYRLTSSVMSDEAHRQQLLTDAMGEMQRFKDKYRRLAELAKVFAAMDEVTSSDLAKSA